MKTPDLITDTVAPLGPNARAMLRRCDCGARDCDYCRFDSRGEQHVAKQPSPRPTVVRLLADTKAVILRRRQECYGALAISDEQADELSRALVQHLLGSYEITGVAP